ncbi:hypothetical protein [Bacillus weihaiensis]|uniref:hypothetical protein n=1 Tax=Bacillus weihaiensis TaxID=1547283 RepID=UPI0013143FC5|nr:hypothetical protein [Bacillus weihaiensis]
MQVKYIENGVEKEIIVDRLRDIEEGFLTLIIIRDGLSFEHKMSLDKVTSY